MGEMAELQSIGSRCPVQVIAGSNLLYRQRKEAAMTSGHPSKSKLIGRRSFFERDQSDIPMEVRSYFIAMKWYLGELRRNRNILQDDDNRSSILTFLKEVEGSLHEAKSWLSDYVDEKNRISVVELAQMLRDHAARDLDAALSSPPDIFEERPANESQEVSSRLLDEVRKNGYKLYHVLLGDCDVSDLYPGARLGMSGSRAATDMLDSGNVDGVCAPASAMKPGLEIRTSPEDAAGEEIDPPSCRPEPSIRHDPPSRDAPLHYHGSTRMKGGHCLTFSRLTLNGETARLQMDGDWGGVATVVANAQKGNVDAFVAWDFQQVDGTTGENVGPRTRVLRLEVVAINDEAMEVWGIWADDGDSENYYFQGTLERLRD